MLRRNFYLCSTLISSCSRSVSIEFNKAINGYIYYSVHINSYQLPATSYPPERCCLSFYLFAVQCYHEGLGPLLDLFKNKLLFVCVFRMHIYGISYLAIFPAISVYGIQFPCMRWIIPLVFGPAPLRSPVCHEKNKIQSDVVESILQFEQFHPHKLGLSTRIHPSKAILYFTPPDIVKNDDKIHSLIGKR